MHSGYDVAITLLCMCYRVNMWLDYVIGSTTDLKEIDNDVDILIPIQLNSLLKARLHGN